MNKKKIDSERHQVFLDPPNLNDFVWRYLDLPKLISILDKKKLFLPRITLFNDPLEGSIPQKNKEVFEDFYKKSGNIEGKKETSDYARALMDFTYVSCWHLNNNESEAMWKLYCGSNQGIALRTSYKKLTEVIKDTSFQTGLVRYIDYDTEYFGYDKNIIRDKKFYHALNLANAFMHKRNVFEHEKEVRIIKIDYDSLNKNIFVETKKKKPPLGIFVDFDINDIKMIYVNPYADNWYFDVVNSVISKYLYDLKLMWSSIKRDPLYL